MPRSVYQPVTMPTKKTSAAVMAKDAARVMAEALIRPVAQRIADNRGVDAGDKVALGLNPRVSPRTPIKPPHVGPLLSIGGVSNLSIILRYHSATKGKAARPSRRA